jgi:hypothetical protein
VIESNHDEFRELAVVNGEWTAAAAASIGGNEVEHIHEIGSVNHQQG